jgi:6-phosphofructokinase 1
VGNIPIREGRSSARPSAGIPFATEYLGRLHITAASHDRVIVVELIGRHGGWMALHAGVAGPVDAILLPGIPSDVRRVADTIRQRDARGRACFMVVVAEGPRPVGGHRSVLDTSPGQAERLEGADPMVAGELDKRTGHEALDSPMVEDVPSTTPAAACATRP